MKDNVIRKTDRRLPGYYKATCPECGHPIPADEVAAELSPMQRKLYEIVRRAGVAGISAREILVELYAHDPSGGPTGTNIVSVFAHYANVRLKKRGLEITARRGPWPLWRLLPYASAPELGD
jgi:hypothetical protein